MTSTATEPLSPIVEPRRVRCGNSILPVICAGSRREQKTTKPQQKEKRETEHGLLF